MIKMVELRKPSISTLIKLIATLVGIGLLIFIVISTIRSLIPG